MAKEIKETIKTEDTKTGKTILLIVAFLLFVCMAFGIGAGVGGYLTLKENADDIVDKNNSKENNNETENKNDNEETNDTEDNTCEEEYLYGINLISHKIEQLDYILDVGKISDTSKIEDKYLFDFALINMPNAYEEFDDEGLSLIKLEDINNFLKDTLNTTLKTPQDFQATFNICTYKEETKNFSCAGHGGMSYSTFNRIVSAKLENGIYTIEVKKAISEVNDIGYNDQPYYGTVEDLKQKKNQLFKANMVEIDDELEYDTHPLVLFNNKANSELPTYTYKFKKVEENYILISLTY